jgi:predicted enzyme related to lactoylglutathione lyase
MLRVGSVVIRVDDVQRQFAFWSAALGCVPATVMDMILLRPPDGIGPNVTLDRWHADVQVPPKIHLDLYADDQAAEVERLIGLGATRVSWKRMPDGADFVILADPEGNRFCVIDKG